MCLTLRHGARFHQITSARVHHAESGLALLCLAGARLCNTAKRPKSTHQAGHPRRHCAAPLASSLKTGERRKRTGVLDVRR
jgi:hypothetical protein